MSEKEYADIFFSIRQSIYFYWNFFIIGIIVALGWTASWELAQSSPLLKGTLTAGIILLAINCLLSQLLNYSLIEATRRDWCASAKTEQSSNNLLEHIKRLTYANHKYFIWAVHLFLGLAVITFIWFGKIPSI